MTIFTPAEVPEIQAVNEAAHDATEAAEAAEMAAIAAAIFCTAHFMDGFTDAATRHGERWRELTAKAKRLREEASNA